MRCSRLVHHVFPAGGAAVVVMLLAMACTTPGAGPDAGAAPQPADAAGADETTYVATRGCVIVRGHDRPVVDRLACRGEQIHARLRRRLPSPERTDTTGVIEIILHPSPEAYRAAVGAAWAEVEAHTVIHRENADGPPRCTIHLIQPSDADALEDKLIGRILPHELAHATLEARFVKAPPPLYLQEGLAVAAEADGHRAAILRVGLAVAEGRDVPLAELVRRREVDGAAAPLFYAQSYSFVTYLRRQMTDRQFARFLDELARGRPTFDALRGALRVGHDAFPVAALQQGWQDDAVRQAALVAASAPTSKPAAGSPKSEAQNTKQTRNDKPDKQQTTGSAAVRLGLPLPYLKPEA